MSKEIKITEYELKECNGNLKNLSSTWAGVPKVPVNTIDISSGNSAECVKDFLEVTTQVSDSMQQLLDNSVEFFEALGISFHDSDALAAQNINTLTD